MAESVPDFTMKKVENFCFNLLCMYNRKTEQRSAKLNPSMSECFITRGKGFMDGSIGKQTLKL